MIKVRVTSPAELFLFAGLLCTCLGSYFGNVFVAAGHGLLLLAMALLGVLARKHPSAASPECGSCPRPVRWSVWFLLALVFAIAASVAVNWSDIKEPLQVLKKTRYHLIWAGLILLPASRTLLARRLADWAPWLLLAWLASLSLATLGGLAGMMTGYHPLLLRPAPYPTRAAGVSSTVMTYAYSLQFSVLLLSALAFNRKSALDWMIRGRTCLRPIVYFALALALAGLYLSFSRGAVAGVLAGAFTLALVSRRKWLLPLGAGLLILLAAWGVQHHQRYFSVEVLKRDSVRVSQWQTAYRTFLEHPWFGVGYRQFEERSVDLKQQFGMPMDDFKKTGRKRVPVYFKGHAHNELLEALASTGLLGGFVFLGFCACWIREVSRGALARCYFLPVIVAFLVSGSVQNMFTDSEVLNFLLFLFALSQCVLDAEEGRLPEELAQDTSRTM